MTRRSRCFASALVGGLLSTSPAWAADLPIAGRAHIVASGTVAMFVAKSRQQPGGLPFALPVPGSSTDPTVAGATLGLFDVDASGAGLVTLTLGAAGWSGLGTPPGSKGYRYRGSDDAAGACTVVLLKSTVIKALCKGPSITLAPPYSGDAGIVLGLSTGPAAVRYCADFGGDTSRNDASRLKRTNAPVPDVCPRPCAGLWFEGACWFVSELSESCAQACAAEGLDYDPATRTVAGSDGTDEDCGALLDLIGFPGMFVGGVDCDGFSSGTGCAAAPIDFVAARCTAPATTADAAEFQRVRLCACR